MPGRVRTLAERLRALGACGGTGVRGCHVEPVCGAKPGEESTRASLPP